jgi:hypothetical protein
MSGLMMLVVGAPFLLTGFIVLLVWLKPHSSTAIVAVLRALPPWFWKRNQEAT